MTSGVWHMSLVCRWDLSTDGKFGLNGKRVNIVLWNVTCVPESFALFPYRAHCTAVLFHLGRCPTPTSPALLTACYLRWKRISCCVLILRYCNRNITYPLLSLSFLFIIVTTHTISHPAGLQMTDHIIPHSLTSHPSSFLPHFKATVSLVIRSSGVFHHPTETSTAAASLVQIILG